MADAERLDFSLVEQVDGGLGDPDPFDGCAAVCPFYWGEWSMGTPDNPPDYDCGCTFGDESLADELFSRFVDGGAATGCPVFALVRIWWLLGLPEDSIDDVLDLPLSLGEAVVPDV